MIELSNKLKQILSEPVYENFFLVKIGNYRTTDLYTSVTFNNELYQNDGRLYSVAPPQMNSIVDRELYKLVFQNSDLAFSASVGESVEVRILFCENDQPLLSVEDSFLVYKGRVESTAQEIQESESTYIVSCASPMANLDSRNVLMTSKEALRNLKPEDTSFDQVYEGSSRVDLRWGK